VMDRLDPAHGFATFAEYKQAVGFDDWVAVEDAARAAR